MVNALPFFASGPDALTPHGFFAFDFIRSVIIGFLKTHSYAAFYTGPSAGDLEVDGGHVEGYP